MKLWKNWRKLKLLEAGGGVSFPRLSDGTYHAIIFIWRRKNWWKLSGVKFMSEMRAMDRSCQGGSCPVRIFRMKVVRMGSAWIGFQLNLHSSVQFVLLNLELISLTVWKLYPFRKRSNFGNFQQFFIITFDSNGNFEFWWFHRKFLVQL